MTCGDVCRTALSRAVRREVAVGSTPDALATVQELKAAAGRLDLSKWHQVRASGRKKTRR